MMAVLGMDLTEGSRLRDVNGGRQRGTGGGKKVEHRSLDIVLCQRSVNAWR